MIPPAKHWEAATVRAPFVQFGESGWRCNEFGLDNQEYAIQHLYRRHRGKGQPNLVQAGVKVATWLTERLSVTLVIEIETKKGSSEARREIKLETIRDQRAATIRLA